METRIKRKMSKSELILSIRNPKTRDQTLKDLSESAKIPIPRSLFLDETTNPNRIGLDAIKKKKAGELKDFSDTKAAIRVLYRQPKAVVLRAIPSLKELPENESFQSIFEQIFYLSISLRKAHSSAKESALLLLIQKCFLEKREKSFLRYCIHRFSKTAICSFLKSNICNFESIFEFMRFLAPKMENNVIELWFENDFSFIDPMVKRMDKADLRKDLPFDSRVFSHFMQYKSFRKAVFNGNMDREFILQMKEFANRGDFEYFYKKEGIERSLDRSILFKPRDFFEFEFFNSSDLKSNLYSNFIKIRNYQMRIGHNFILHSFIIENLDTILTSLEEHEILEDILKETIKFNNAAMKRYEENNQINKQAVSSKEYKEIKDANDSIFQHLKKYEDSFRRISKYFYNPPDAVLQKLISADFDLSAKEAAEYINFGYEKELTAYFKTRKIDEIISVFDDWTCKFFLELLSDFDYDVESATKAFEFIYKEEKIKNKFKEQVASIYNCIMKVEDPCIFKMLPEDLQFIYTLRHKTFVPEFCSKAKDNMRWKAWLYEIQTTFNDVELPVSLRLESIEFNDENMVESLFNSTFILKQDSLYLFVQNFEKFVKQCLDLLSKEDLNSLSQKNLNLEKYFLTKTSSLDRIIHTIEPDITFGLLEKIIYVMSFNLSNKYVLYIIFNKILRILNEGASKEKIFVLSFIDSSLLIKEHILEFINSLIPLLNSSNATVCKLSKLKFGCIRVESREIQNVIPQIILALLDKEAFADFLNAFKAIQFNNYLCFNSLNIIAQIILKYLSEYPAECFDILKRIINITKDRDLRHISRLIFVHMNKFVVRNNFCTADALEVASQFCLHTEFEDFSVLLENLSSLKIANYLVRILQIKGNSELNDKIIRHVLEKNNAVSGVEPAFIAAACELEEFFAYLDQFIPKIKEIYESEKIEERQIACRAFKAILNSRISEEYKETISKYLIDCCIYSEHAIRLQTLDILEYLPVIFVLRHDQHSLVKKKAYEVWKKNVTNTNKELKTCYIEVFNLIRYRRSKSFCSSLKAMLAELLLKYPSHAEAFINEDHETEIKEFILIEAFKINRLVNEAVSFCKINYCPELFKIISKNPNLRSEIIENIDESCLFDFCAEDSDLAYYMFSRTNDFRYIEYLSTNNKIDIVKAHYQNRKTVSHEDENIIFILQSIESCKEIENLLLRIPVVFSYYYVSVQRVDCGALVRIFERLFENTRDLPLEPLILERNLKFIKNCSFENIKEKMPLLVLLLKGTDRKSFERVVEILNDKEIILDMPLEQFFEVLGFLFRNMLLENRKYESERSILNCYDNRKEEMHFFKKITEATILKK